MGVDSGGPPPLRPWARRSDEALRDDMWTIGGMRAHDVTETVAPGVGGAVTVGEAPPLYLFM